MADNELLKAILTSLNLPDWFYNYFLGELIKSFGADWLIPDENYIKHFFGFNGADDEEYLEDYVEWKEANLTVPALTYSYKDQIVDSLDFLFAGTVGWASILKRTCKETDNEFLNDIYEKLSWENSDYFDKYIEEQIVRIMFDTNQDNKIERSHKYNEFIRQKLNKTE